MRGSLLRCILLVLALALGSRAASAGPTVRPAQISCTDVEPEAREAAQEHLDSGLATQDIARALDFFERSRAICVSESNTLDVAVSLQKLGREDEALEVYDELTERFGAPSGPDKAAIEKAIASLQGKVGRLSISANVEASIVVDDRARGKLPRPKGLYVTAGTHVVRLVKDGYDTYQTTLEVAIGKAVTIQAELKPVDAAGGLVVEGPEGSHANVFVDGVLVGTAPWEGTLGVGRHLIWIRDGDIGSSPQEITVLLRQTVLVRAKAAPIGPPTRIAVVPSTAQIELDGVTVGTSRWEGRLPVGEHRIIVSREGYFSSTRTFNVGKGARTELFIPLLINPDDPSWPPRTLTRLWIGAFGTYLFGTGLGSEAEEHVHRGCAGTCRQWTAANGFSVGLRGEVRLSAGYSLELAVGYQELQRSFTRPLEDQFGAGNSISYLLHDNLRVSGPFAAIGAAVRARIHRRVAILSRLSVGLLYAKAVDPISVETSEPAHDEGAVAYHKDPPTKIAPFVSSALGFEVLLNTVSVDLSLGLTLYPARGPSFTDGAVGRKVNTCAPSNPGAVDCAPNSAIGGPRGEERAFGPFILWSPQIAVAYRF